MDADEPQADGLAESPSRRRRIIGFVSGILLLTAAVFAVGIHSETISQAWGSIQSGSIVLMGLVVVLPLANWLLISVSFWILTGRYGRVGGPEMAGLIATAWLLNYLPMRPGMLGRVAYHKAVNKIAVRDSAKVMLIGITFSGISAAGITVLVAALSLFDVPGVVWGGALCVPVVVLGVLAVAARGGEAWRLPAAGAIRYLDLLVWAARYGVVFALVGMPISIQAALAVAVVSQLAMLIPLSGNGLGLREWAVGITAGILPVAFVGAVAGVDGGAQVVGLAADLLNRAGEILVAVPVGLLGWAYVYKRLGRGKLPSC